MDNSKNIKLGRKQRSRQLIMDAAEKAFHEQGFSSVSMEKIAQQAGLTRMTIYNLFESKEDIVHAIGYRIAANTAPYFHAQIEENTPALDLLRTAFMGSAQWCLDNPTIAPIALAGPRHKTLAPPQEDTSFHALVTEIFALGQKQGAFRTDEAPNTLALVLLGSYAQLMTFALAGGPFEMSSIDLLLRIVIEGAAARSSSAQPPEGSK